MRRVVSQATTTEAVKTTALPDEGDRACADSLHGQRDDVTPSLSPPRKCIVSGPLASAGGLAKGGESLWVVCSVLSNFAGFQPHKT